MDVLKIPADSRAPILFFGLPALRFGMVAVVAALVHAAVSWFLPLGMMYFGFASVNDDPGYKMLSKLCLNSYYVWNFGYYLFWPPTPDHPFAEKYAVVLPAWSAMCGLFIGWLDAVRRKRIKRNRAVAHTEHQPNPAA